MKRLITSLVFLFCSSVVFAKEGEDSLAMILARQQQIIDSVNATMKYETGSISLSGGMAKLNIPDGFKYLNTEQSHYILSELWGNPPQQGVLGMIFPKDGGPFAEKSYAFVITYDNVGYVKDDDAEDINYDKLLKQIQEEEVEENKERAAKGYSTIHMVGWASKPFYDKEHKVLHWAKNLKFGDVEDNTLNYEVRILGRKGVLSLNAIAAMDELDMVKKDIDKVLMMPSFTEGNMYKDFDSKVDDVAAWTIGGLVAGKILAKVGFWAILLKGWKFIVIGIIALWAGIKKFFSRKKNEEEQFQSEPAPVIDTTAEEDTKS